MKQIKVDTGLVTYRLNDAVDVQINTTDITFIGKILDVADSLEEKQKEVDKALSDDKDVREQINGAKKLDTEMREQINGIFGKDICTPLIGDMNIWALGIETGAPIWANILFGLLDEMEANLPKEGEVAKKVEKYTKKYRK